MRISWLLPHSHPPRQVAVRSSPSPLPAATTASPHFVLLDATNISCRAAADAKRWKHVKGHSLASCFEDWLDYIVAATAPNTTLAIFDRPRSRNGVGDNRRPSTKQRIDADYLKRRRQRQGQNLSSTSTPTANDASSNSPLAPFFKAVDRRGGTSLVAEAGLEADDVIGATCALLYTTQQNARITIVSGDGDMQQFLRPRVSWMELLPMPTTAAPAGFAIATDEAFEKQYGFPASSYVDWLAMVGKKEASIGGIGIGTATAAKLVAKFGNVEGAVDAAAQDLLKGWKAEVQAALQPDSPSIERLRRNRALFAAYAEDPSEALSAAQREMIELAMKKVCSGSGGGGNRQKERKNNVVNVSQDTRLSWLHPLQSARWRHVEPIAKQAAALLAGSVKLCSVKAVSAKGLPIDVLLAAENRAIVICCPLDYDKAAYQHAVDERSNTNTSIPNKTQLVSLLTGGATAPPQIKGKLNGAARHHVSLLRKEGLRPICIPWYWFV